MPLAQLRINHTDIYFVSHMADLYLEPYGEYSNCSSDNDEFVIQITGRPNSANTEHQTEPLVFAVLNAEDQVIFSLDFDLQLTDNNVFGAITLTVILHAIHSNEDEAPDVVDIFFYQALMKYFENVLANDTLLWLRVKLRRNLATEVNITTPHTQKFANPAYEALKCMEQTAKSRGANVINNNAAW